MLDGMTPQQFDELVAFNQLEPIGVTPIYRLLVCLTWCMMNQFRGEEKDSGPITMEQIAEFAGLQKEPFNADESEEFVSPEKAASIFRR